MSYEEMDFTDPKMLRSKAEELLITKQKADKNSLVEPDVKKLLHELQVHQIELEMQNEELQKSYEIAEAALKKYTLLYDLAPMGYYTLDSQGTICELNFTGADILGERRFSLVNSNFKLFIEPDSLPIFNNFFRDLYSINKKESCIIHFGDGKKPTSMVYLEGIVTGEERKCLISAVLIPERKKLLDQ
jgi:PAS domain-containing protein